MLGLHRHRRFDFCLDVVLFLYVLTVELVCLLRPELLSVMPHKMR